MTYIWINPVVDSMYERENLDRILLAHGYNRMETSGDWISVVKEKYLQEIQKSKTPVMDVRCPKIKELLEETKNNLEITSPDIQPILLHCGIECSEKKETWEDEKIITTPCRALADMGNALGLKKTTFIPWNRFIESLKVKISQKNLEKSPIPPGFFDTLGVKTASITGENEIKCYLEHGIPEEIQLVEMLFCKDGCHNGDGVRME